MIIFGIDPGSYSTGYGVISSIPRQTQYIDCGCIQNKSKQLGERLQHIFKNIYQLIQQHRPEHIAVEQVFFHRDANAALKLGQARGAALAACVFDDLLPISEYAPRRVKQAVVGYGAAEKQQVQHMVCKLLKLQQLPDTDAADALAIALCHAYTFQSMARRVVSETIGASK